MFFRNIMATYSIAEVEQLTGIQAHTLRIWERRYDLVKAKRTDTKIRFYDDEQLKLLLNVSVLLKHGYRVSKIDKMEVAEIHGITQKLLCNDDTSDEKEIQGLTMSMLSLDEAMFEQILKASCKRHGLKGTVLKLLYPFLHQVGVLWGTNKAMPAQEHFISNLIRKKMFAAIEALPKPKEDAKKLILFLPEGDYHEIGLLLSYYMALELGFKVYYLGQNVPCEDVILTDRIVESDLMMTIILIPRIEYENQVSKICRETSAKVLVSGNLEGMNHLSESIVKLKSPNDFVKFLEGNL